MAYCTRDDILELTDEATLIALTDDAAAGTVDDAKVERAIADAEQEIDASLGMRTSLPLSTVPALVRKWAVDIAVYNLCSRRDAEVPEVRRKRYDDARADLKAYRDGRISLGVEDPESTPSGSEAPRIVSSTPVFGRDKLEGF